ncbi:putative uncharacterized protein [Clostridium sp. CAG:448]|nr:putative uncharacterized protein [Clostridium sp. CAG:448]
MTPLLFAVKVLLAFLDVLMALLFFRMLVSWLPVDEDNRLVQMLYVLTEPALIPMRSLFARMGWFQNTPIDMSFMVTVLILSVLRSVPMVL